MKPKTWDTDSGTEDGGEKLGGVLRDLSKSLMALGEDNEKVSKTVTCSDMKNAKITNELVKILAKRIPARMLRLLINHPDVKYEREKLKKNFNG